jgi:hypothetical protein
MNWALLRGIALALVLLFMSRLPIARVVPVVDVGGMSRLNPSHRIMRCSSRPAAALDSVERGLHVVTDHHASFKGGCTPSRLTAVLGIISVMGRPPRWCRYPKSSARHGKTTVLGMFFVLVSRLAVALVLGSSQLAVTQVGRAHLIVTTEPLCWR